MFSCWLYFSLTIMATRDCGWFNILHSCLARSSLLKCFKSLKPIPSLHLWALIFFQLNQCIFYHSTLDLYQKLAIIQFNSLQRVFRRRNTLMEYTGKARRKAFINTYLFALERTLCSQLDIFIHTFSFIHLFYPYFMLQIWYFHPYRLKRVNWGTYGSYHISFLPLLVISHLSFAEVLELKMMEDIWLLTTWPDPLS